MKGEIQIKYDNENKIISKKFLINSQEVSEEELFNKLNELNKIEIIHCILPLYNRGFGNSYGWGYILEDLKSDKGYIYLSMYRFSNSWGQWSDIGMSGCKYDLKDIALSTKFDNFDLEKLIKLFVKKLEWNELIDLIEKYSDYFLYEKDLISEISEKYNIDENEIDSEIIEKYIKEKYDSNLIINIIDDEDNIYSIIT